MYFVAPLKIIYRINLTSCWEAHNLIINEEKHSRKQKTTLLTRKFKKGIDKVDCG